MKSENLGVKIKELRTQKGLTQQELAQKLGYRSRSTINKIELGINDIPYSKIIEFSAALETDVSTLLKSTNNDINELLELMSSLPTDKIKILLDFAKQLKNN